MQYNPNALFRIHKAEFRTWTSIRSRCKREPYKSRGIQLCTRWQESFQNFLDDMGPKPSPDHSIDRIDNTKGYSPDNCRWATRSEQQRNTSRSVYLTFQGETLTVPEWAERTGMTACMIYTRIKRNWPTEDILTLPQYGRYRGAQRGNQTATINNNTKTVRQWCNELQINYALVCERIRFGWSPEKALTTPVGNNSPNRTRKPTTPKNRKPQTPRPPTELQLLLVDHKSEYRIWTQIISRCSENARDPSRYADRGITVCDRWKESFASFLSDMGPRPSKKHSIDRIDNDGDYTPENCRWATATEQSRNRSSNRLLTFDSKTLPVSEWAEITGISHSNITHRLKRGWSVEETLTTKESGLHQGSIRVTINGRSKRIKEWARELGINPNTIYERIKRGWDPLKAVTTPIRKYDS